MEPVQKRIKLLAKPQEKKGILDLPNEVLELIFLQLSQYEIQRNLALVCKRFLTITRHPKFVETVKIEPIGKVDKWTSDHRVEYDFPGM